MSCKPICVSDLEAEANKCLPHSATEFYSSTSVGGQTYKRNASILKRILIVPRVLRDVSNIDMRVKLFDFEISSPIAIAPTAFHGFAHSEGELATVKGAYSADTLCCVSAVSSFTIESITASSMLPPLWQNVYLYKELSITMNFIERAQRCGIKAIVISCDIAILSKRNTTWNNHAYDPMMSRKDQFAGNFPIGDTLHIDGRDDATFEMLSTVVKATRLPVIAKGIMTEAAALHALDAGVAAVFVSTHGGRQLDGTLSTLEILPGIVKAINGRCDVYVDSGFRTGTDIFKAVALGAKMVFVGRPIIWGLAYDGNNGVEYVLNLLQSELKVAMANAGCKTIADIKHTSIVHEQLLSKI